MCRLRPAQQIPYSHSLLTGPEIGLRAFPANLATAALLPTHYGPTAALLPTHFGPTAALLPTHYGPTAALLPTHYGPTAALLKAAMDVSNGTNGTEAPAMPFYMHGAVVTALYICGYCLVFSLNVVGNAVVCWVIVTTPRLHTATNYFILNLAVADLLVAVFCIPFTLVEHILFDYQFGDVMCKLNVTIQGVSVAASVYTLSVIAVERYVQPYTLSAIAVDRYVQPYTLSVIAVDRYVQPYTLSAIVVERYYVVLYPADLRMYYVVLYPADLRMSGSAVWKALAGIWGAAALIMLPQPFVLETQEYDFEYRGGETASFCKENWPAVEYRHAYTLALFVLVYCGPLVAVTCIYCRIGVSIWYRSSLPLSTTMELSQPRVISQGTNQPRVIDQSQVTGHDPNQHRVTSQNRNQSQVVGQNPGQSRVIRQGHGSPRVIDQTTNQPRVKGQHASHHRQVMGQDSKQSRVMGQVPKRRIRVTKMLVTVVAMFALSWLPLYVSWMLDDFGSLSDSAAKTLFYYVYPVAHWVAYFNSCVNPIIYGLFRSDVRKNLPSRASTRTRKVSMTTSRKRTSVLNRYMRRKSKQETAV
ncbi:NPFFR2 [Branchiostoma lanceolatum]|uniref:NPFFR2 protein n=1 Tax=Branchiostoma lanceolatum TaxID=7740 RepID=A0A8J9Z509_BRALA|nr:NPFFR2 [Branchiostoma lanceolatum]